MEDACPDVKKSSWPELLGVKGEVAVKCIKRENPGLDVYIVEEGNSVLTDFRCERVWVWVDKHGFVKQVPHIG